MSKRNLKIWIFFSLIGIANFIYYQFPDTAYQLRLKVSAICSVPSDDFVTKNSLKKIQINFTPEDELHFEVLFENFSNDKFPDDSLHTYNKQNRWRNTTITVNEKEYAVKVKCHGRSPYRQKFGNYFSLAIKFQNELVPGFAKRINLIVYNRIQLTGDLLSLTTSKFNIPIPKQELALVTFGTKGDCFFFVEERIDSSYFSSRNLPCVIFNKKIDGSLIMDETSNLSTLNAQLEKELSKKNNAKKYSTNLTLQIKQDYNAFNVAIEGEDVSDLSKYMDLNYLAKVNAFRIIYGSDGHGFDNVNIEMAYDTIVRKFYPLLHRDINSTVLENCSNPYVFMDETRNNIPFWMLLDSDSNFVQKTQNQLAVFMSSTDVKTMQKELEELHEYYKKSHVFEFSYLNNIYDGQAILQNMKCLKQSIVE